jgi:RimJ/RimL family protein N-acetyltransferase
VLVQDPSEQLKERMEKFPSYYSNVLTSWLTSIVVCLAIGDEIVGACGIQRPFNYFVAYVQERYRGRGLGTRALKKIIHIAKRQNLNFINLAVSTENMPALRLYSKLGFRETALFPSFKFKVMTLPLTFRGELAYIFLHEICSILPETLLIYLLVFLMSVAKRIRQIVVSGTS